MPCEVRQALAASVGDTTVINAVGQIMARESEARRSLLLLQEVRLTAQIATQLVGLIDKLTHLFLQIIEFASQLAVLET